MTLNLNHLFGCLKKLGFLSELNQENTIASSDYSQTSGNEILEN